MSYILFIVTLIRLVLAPFRSEPPTPPWRPLS